MKYYREEKKYIARRERREWRENNNATARSRIEMYFCSSRNRSAPRIEQCIANGSASQSEYAG
jgi:hypothetical protein